ncbi:38742_t:CDS:2 [Gigaspora margarita]|uniref:38742_t:CDS:1 n=1 Tax=Gigaspora margarita TaxID=4874 RepID=A0ABN7USR1_GIGMA|nr:38742_t:CDS:2 [Gigaspora margarita]
MVNRVEAAKYSMDLIVRSTEKNMKDLSKKSYFLAFERFKNVLAKIKEFTSSVSKLKGYKKFFQATDVKKKFEQLIDEFDKCKSDLHFAIDVSNGVDRKEESERVDKALKEVDETLKQLDDKIDESVKQVGDKVDESFKQVSDQIDAVAQRIIYMQTTRQGDANKIDSSELSDPQTQKNQGRVFKKIYKSFIEVACKPIDGQNEAELAIIRKLGLSPQILKFYGHSEINNTRVMIFEWAEQGSLKELYEKYDIPWTRKIQIAKDIVLGLLFLRTVNVFHHDLRCENVFVLRDLSVKLGNFGCAREVDDRSRNLSQLATYIVRWMAPELIKKYISNQGNYENKRVYTFNCEMFSFGMLLWELSYEKLPYAEWNIKKISDHVLSGNREKVLKGRFTNHIDKDIQLEFIKIIQDAWCQQPELRITIPTLRQRLEGLAVKYPIPLDAPTLFKNKVLDFDGQNSESFPEFDHIEIPEEVTEEPALVSLEDGIKMHKKRDYKSAWECFKQNADLNNPLAKFWLAYYSHYGHYGEKNPIQAKKLFKEAADEHNHSESQCRYAVLLLEDLSKETNESKKDKLRKEILRYFELAANNSNQNVDAMYYLGDIYVGGKLKVRKDEERGLNYLRLAANSNNERAISLLKKLGKPIK